MKQFRYVWVLIGTLGALALPALAIASEKGEAACITCHEKLSPGDTPEFH